MAGPGNAPCIIPLRPNLHSPRALQTTTGGTFRLEGGADAIYPRHGHVAVRVQASFLNQSSGEADAAALWKLLLDASGVYDKVFVASGLGTWYPNIEFATNPYVVRRRAAPCTIHRLSASEYSVGLPVPQGNRSAEEPHNNVSLQSSLHGLCGAWKGWMWLPLSSARRATPPQANSAGRGAGVKPGVGRELALHFTLKLQARP